MDKHAPAWELIATALGTATIMAMAVCWLAGEIAARLGFCVPEPTRRIGDIDGLRGYLALFVLVSHFSQWTRVVALDLPWGTGPDQLKALGQVPVAIFFMITGLLFYTKARDGFGATRWREFVVARLFRIYPLALLSIGAVVTLLWARTGFTTDISIWSGSGWNLLRWIAFVDQPPLFGFADSYLLNAGVFWSLTSEWAFYLAVLPAIAVARSLTRRWLPAWSTPLWTIVAAAILRIVWREQADYMLHFMLGMFIAQVVEAPRAVAFFQRRAVGVGAVLLMVAAIAFLPPPIRDRTAIFYAPFLACVACGQRFGGLFSNRGSIVLGEVSFGIYVLHGLVLWIGFWFAGSLVATEPVMVTLLMLPLFALLAVLVAIVAHVFVEKPMIQLGRRMTAETRTLVVPQSSLLRTE